MKRILVITTAVAALAATAAAADSQLVANAGISRSTAANLTLAEIAAYKFNRDSDGDARQAIVSRSGATAVEVDRHAQLIAAAGLDAEETAGMSLGALGIAKHNAASRTDDDQAVVAGASQKPVDPARDGQLIAAAGLTADSAAGMTLGQVAALKFNRDSRNDDRQ